MPVSGKRNPIEIEMEAAMKGKVGSVLFTLLIVACGGKSQAQGQGEPIPGEGFYPPGAVSLPAGVERGLRGVVRVNSKIRFRLQLFADGEAASRARRVEGARVKEFIEEGGVIWPVLVDTTALRGLCGHPAGRVQPGFTELCDLDWRSRCETFPCTLLTDPLAGSATGVVIGRSPRHGLLVATNYHIAREAAERLGRTDGVYRLRPTPVQDLIVAIDTTGAFHPGGYRGVAPVWLVANASEADWQEGADWAVLAIPGVMDEHVEVVPLASDRPRVGDTLWAAGFPYRTVRGEASEEKGYPNAADELRVSVGMVVSPDSVDVEGAPYDILSTLDAVPGSSGSPVFNERGEVVGLVRDGTCKEGEIDLRILRYCGFTQIVPVRFLAEVLETGLAAGAVFPWALPTGHTAPPALLSRRSSVAGVTDEPTLPPNPRRPGDRS